ncbi:MAG TPA: hypothetical protein VFR29_06195 [Steroidobacteraceae bacterium]|nr:hypothetical protein [Steroidobacteraceae bacterium]
MRDLAISLLLLRIFVTQELPAWPMTAGPSAAEICACAAAP